MNLTVWGKVARAHSISRSERVEHDREIEEIDIGDGDHEDIPVLEADQMEENVDEEPGPDDNDWQEVYSLNGCSTYFG